MDETPLILASSSRRRRRLLADAGYQFKVVAPTIPEPDGRLTRLSADQQAQALAYFKARTVADKAGEAYVLAADTLVAAGDRILGKPTDADQARRMLADLAGTRHAVITGVALLGPHRRRLIASERTYVTMRSVTDEELAEYVASGEWEGKAGAYAIQETADRFVDRLEGSFSNVVGLPLDLLARMIDELRVRPGKRGTS